MTPQQVYDLALATYSVVRGRADHAGARARESGSKKDWKEYGLCVEEMARALADLDRAHQAMNASQTSSPKGHNNKEMS